VTVVLERDEAKRVVDIPPLLKKALANSKSAQSNWKKQSFSNQKEMARSITEVKQEDTRGRRLTRVMDILTSGKKWTG
jgi:uncharacterized protein YdeI (YjbR/CyaY-like superfamily)